MSNRWLIARVRLLSNLGTFFQLFLERGRPRKTRKAEKKQHDVRPDISNAAQAINSCANAHMCAFDFWESNSVELLPLNCWCLIADFHCFSPYYWFCHNFVLLGKGFTSTSRLYKIATYQPLWCFMGEIHWKVWIEWAGNFGSRRILSRYSKRAKGFGGLGLLAFGSHNSSSA